MQMPTLKGISQSVKLFLTRKREECKEKVLYNSLFRKRLFWTCSPLAIQLSLYVGFLYDDSLA